MLRVKVTRAVYLPYSVSCTILLSTNCAMQECNNYSNLTFTCGFVLSLFTSNNIGGVAGDINYKHIY